MSPTTRPWNIPEIFELILEGLSPGELFSAALVSRLWSCNTLPILWRKMSYSDLMEMDDSLESARNSVVDLTYTDYGHILSGHFPRLRALEIKLKSPIPESFNEKILPFIRGSPSCDSIRLDCFSILQIDSGFPLLRVVNQLLLCKPNRIRSILLKSQRKSFSLGEREKTLFSEEGLKSLKQLKIRLDTPLLEHLLRSLESIEELEVWLGQRYQPMEFSSILTKTSLNNFRITGSRGKMETEPSLISGKSLAAFYNGSLRELKLYARSLDLDNKSIGIISGNFPNLRKLHLDIYIGMATWQTSTSSISISAVNSIGKNCEYLEELTLPDGTYQLSGLNTRFLNLRHLKFGFWGRTKSEESEVERIATRIKEYMPRLKDISGQLGHAYYEDALRALLFEANDQITLVLSSGKINESGKLEYDQSREPYHLTMTTRAALAIPRLESIMAENSRLQEENALLQRRIGGSESRR